MPSSYPYANLLSAAPGPCNSSRREGGFQVPSLEIPSSGALALEGDLPRLSPETWDALCWKSNQLLDHTAQQEWSPTLLSTLAQTRATAPFSLLPHPSPVAALETPSPLIEARSSNFLPTLDRSFNSLPPPAEFALPPPALSVRPSRPHDANHVPFPDDVTCVNALLSALTSQTLILNAPQQCKAPFLATKQTHQGSVGVSIPSAYRVPTSSPDHLAPPSLSLPSPQFTLPGFQGLATADGQLAASEPPVVDWSTRGGSGSTITPKAVRWPTPPFSALASRWSVVPGTAVQSWADDVSHSNAVKRSPSLESVGRSGLEPGLSYPPRPAKSAPEARIPAQFVSRVPSSRTQERPNLIEMLVAAKTSYLKKQPLHTSPPQTLAGAVTLTPSSPAPIGNAFPTLDPVIPRLRLSQPTDVSSLDLHFLAPLGLVKEEPESFQLDWLDDREERPGTSKGARARQLSREEIAVYFDLPISMASKKLRVGLTMLKKRCRDLGILRWPHRKLKSMNALIETVQQLGARHTDGPARQIGSAIERLEAERFSIESAPALKLTPETRRFRQACFKAKYKQRGPVSASRKTSS